MARNSSFRAPKRRRLSQNFLTNPHIAAALVRHSGIGRDDLVVEIGPGTGMVTRALAARAGHVIAYELDAALARKLSDRYQCDRTVRCFNRDFLSTSPPEQPFSIVSNIPYARTAAIVDWCLHAPELRNATLVTQLEYARKRTGDFGRWSQLTVQTWPVFEWRLLGKIARHNFDPVPRVDAGILRLERRSTPLLNDVGMRRYRRFVALGFTGRGGNLAASLRTEFSSRAVSQTLRRSGVDPASVVAYVTPSQWLAIFTLLHCRSRPTR